MELEKFKEAQELLDAIEGSKDALNRAKEWLKDQRDIQHYIYKIPFDKSAKEYFTELISEIEVQLAKQQEQFNQL